MATITLRPIRQQTDVTLRATLTDNGVRMSWPDFSRVAAFIYSERQRIIAGECTVEVDPEDDTVLICRYDATKPQHLGIQKLVIACTYGEQKNTYDKQAFQFVATTDETLDDGTTVEDEVAEVDIDVTDLDTSALTGAITEALYAAQRANAAAAEAEAAATHEPYIDETTGNWFVWDPDAQEYVDTGQPAQGDPGFTFTPSTDPMDVEYQDEYQRVLAVLYQAIADVRDSLTRMTEALQASAQAAQEAARAAAEAEAASADADGSADNADSAAYIANQKAALAAQAAEAAARAAQAASDAAAEVEGAAEAAAEAAQAATQAAQTANDKAALADQKATAAATQAAYAKEQGDYAKEEIDGAKGDFPSLNDRFNATEEVSVTLDPTTNPADQEYQDEYQRVLSVLYQAINDVVAALQLTKDSTTDARSAAAAANQAASNAALAAAEAQIQARSAEAAAAAARAAMDEAKGSYPSLSARLNALEDGKQDKINDLEQIRAGATAGAEAYQKPASGIPKRDLHLNVQQSLGKADMAYQKPETGIPLLDLSSGVQGSLGKADTAIQFVENNDPSRLVTN